MSKHCFYRWNYQGEPFDPPSSYASGLYLRWMSAEDGCPHDLFPADPSRWIQISEAQFRKADAAWSDMQAAMVKTVIEGGFSPAIGPDVIEFWEAEQFLCSKFGNPVFGAWHDIKAAFTKLGYFEHVKDIWVHSSWDADLLGDPVEHLRNKIRENLHKDLDG